MSAKAIVTNRNARRDYIILGTVEAGIQLKGSEVKSLRAHRANLKDSFAHIDKNHEIVLYNMHISPYEHTGANLLPDPARPRKLLLHKAQIMNLLGQVSQKHLTLIPLRVYFKKGFAKVELAVAKGKKLYDKRETIKKREHDLAIRRAVRGKR